jgi:hypothetical protein
MTFSFYIDESGHSGDAVRSGTAYDFIDQPIFALAAIGIEDESGFVRDIEPLRTKHRAPTGELKSKSLRADFTADLIAYICDRRLPFFAEVVDKRYFICIKLIESQLLPPIIGYEPSEELHFLKNSLADFLYQEVSDHVLDQFVAACLDPSDHTLMSAFGSQLLFTAGTPDNGDDRDFREAMRHMIVTTMSEYAELRKSDGSAHLRFLPVGDMNKRGKQVWMLPNLSSFTNIYARINLFRHGRLADVKLVHDEQLELDDILRESKRAAETIRQSGLKPFTPHADYQFNEAATLEFVKSHECPGIQAADVVAGALMRFYRDRLRGDTSGSTKVDRAVRRLVFESDSYTGIGVNQVMTVGLAL